MSSEVLDSLKSDFKAFLSKKRINLASGSSSSDFESLKHELSLCQKKLESKDETIKGLEDQCLKWQSQLLDCTDAHENEVALLKHQIQDLNTKFQKQKISRPVVIAGNDRSRVQSSESSLEEEDDIEAVMAVPFPNPQ